MSSQPQPRIPPEEYLTLERRSEGRSEYVNGQVYAMTGASRAHNLIVWNIAGELRERFRGRPCEAYVSDMRVKVDPTGLYTYPDVAALCGEPRFEDAEVDTLLNPAVIIEVLSPSTEAYDRGEKFAHYRRLASLTEYVLLAQDRARAERYVRQGEGWVLTEISEPDGVLPLDALGCAVALRELYERVAFSEGD